MTRVLRAFLVAFAMLAALAFVAGCGSEEENDYVDQVNEVQNAFLEDMQAAATQPPPTNPQQAGDFVNGMQEAVQTAADEFSAIEAPDDVADQHEALITLMQNIADQMGQLEKTLASGNPQQLQEGVLELQTTLTEAQTEITSLIDDINAQLQD